MTAYVFTPMSIVDFAYGLEAVTVRPLGTGSVQSIAVTNAKRSVLSNNEALVSDGRYIRGDLVWNMPASEVGDLDPAPGSAIVDSDGVIYTVQTCERINYNTRVRFVSRALSILAGLDTLVTIQSVTYAKGLSEAAEPTWATWRENVRAKITEISRAVAIENDLRLDRKNYEVEFEEASVGALLLGKDYRIADRDSNTYAIQDFVRGTIGSLPLAHCIGDPWTHT